MNNYKKNFSVMMELLFGKHQKLSKQSETFLNLLCFEFIEKIIKTCNKLLHPTDYENEIVKTFPKKKLTNREIETSMLLLFPEKMVKCFLEDYRDSRTKVFFSKSVTEYLVKKAIVNNVEITKESIELLTFFTEKLIHYIFTSYGKIEKGNKVITNRGFQTVFERKKELNKMLKVLNISI
jgi:hypothetical protein